MGKELIFVIFGIILVSGLAYGGVIDASSIQEVNGQLVFENISCYTCEGATCNATDVGALPVQACNLFGAECVTTFSINGAVAARGCSNLLSNTANATCISNPGQLCFNCVSPLCNVAMQVDEFVDCYQCNSYSNSECVWNPNDTSVSVVQCYGSCIVALLPKSSNDNSTYETYRGCESEITGLGISSCTSGPNCWNCNGTKCNSFNEPNNRLTCNFCTNSECNTTFSQSCLSYRADDRCAYVLNNDSSVSYLACASNFDPSTLDYLMGLGILVECNGANCNTLTGAPHPQMTASSCMSCSSQNNEYCATDPSQISDTVQCEDINKMCVTRITSDGHTMRGCLADQAKVDFLECYNNSNATYCDACNGTDCNNQLFPVGRLACFQCNSNDDSNCTSNPTNATVCPIFSSSQTCTQYRMNSTVYRGCSYQMPCNDNDMCTTCSTTACNSKDLGNGSTTIQMTGALLLASLLVIAYQALGL